MTKLHFVHICEMAFFAEDKKLNVVGVFNEIMAPGFPAVQPRFTIVTGISADTGAHSEIIEIQSPAGEVITQTKEAEINVNNTSQRGHFIANFLNTSFPAPGKYKIVIKVDGEVANGEDDFITVNQLPPVA